MCLPILIGQISVYNFLLILTHFSFYFETTITGMTCLNLIEYYAFNIFIYLYAKVRKNYLRYLEQKNLQI
jgi:hypothetical protein